MLKKYIIIFLALALAISSSPVILAAPVTITINASVEHQTIQGLGGFMESHYGYQNDSEFWNLLYKEVGVSAVRSDGLAIDYLSDSSLDEERLTMYRIAKQYGVNVFGSINSHKPQWKDSGVIGTGHLLPQYYDAYANYNLDIIDYIKAQTGVDITHFFVIAEPSVTGSSTSPNPQIEATPVEYRDLLKVLGPIFRSRNPNVKIYIPCEWNVQSSINYANTILSDSQARQYVDGLASNGYGWISGKTSPAEWTSLANLAKQYNIDDIWVPEQALFTKGGNPGADPSGLITAQMVHESLSDGDAGIWMNWLMIDKGQFSSDMRGFVYSKGWPYKDWNNDGVIEPSEYEFQTNGITKVGYAFKQFAHWVRPGAIRIDAISPDPDILVSSYKLPADNTFTIVAINKGYSVKTVNVNINNYNPLLNLFAYRTSLTENTAYLGQVAVNNNSFSYILPIGSITTFTVVSDKPIVSTPPPPPAPLPAPTSGSSPVKVGYSWQWLVITLVSLALAGGYLLRKKIMKSR